MSKFIQGVVIRQDVAEHPAARAWEELRAGGPIPKYIEILNERRKKPLGYKSAVYRLYGIGKSDSAVVAKRCDRSTATRERDVYEKILPRTMAPTLEFYGLVEQCDADCFWLFFEDAAGEPFDRTLASHRAVAARWLATMHASASAVPALQNLPDGGVDVYFQQLCKVESHLGMCLAHQSLSADDKTVLDRLRTLIEDLGKKWEQLTSSCQVFPLTLVHGDFTDKNLRIRRRGELTLAAFDWEMAVASSPAADLYWFSSSDLMQYHSMIREAWPHVDAVDVERLAMAGKTFRHVARLSWSAFALVECCKADWIFRPMAQLRIYADDIERFLASNLRVSDS